jgi:hypothetical protein
MVVSVICIQIIALSTFLFMILIFQVPYKVNAIIIKDKINILLKHDKFLAVSISSSTLMILNANISNNKLRKVTE